MKKPMTQSQIASAQKAGGLNASQRAADNRQDTRQHREITKAISGRGSGKR